MFVPIYWRLLLAFGFALLALGFEPALNTIGVDHKDAIRMDINHIKHMDATAYRIHRWDREISDKNGVAYQWYPTGLVANATHKANSLLNVAHNPTPFDNLPGCNQKAKMFYEFDAADVNNATPYPAMARSFREAGFQWATMFTYDLGHLAHTNAPYNTHYLNLQYRPHKPIGFLIASEVFATQKLRAV